MPGMAGTNPVALLPKKAPTNKADQFRVGGFISSHPGVANFVFGDGSLRAKAPRRVGRGAAAVTRLRGRATVKMTTDEIMALTRPE